MRDWGVIIDQPQVSMDEQLNFERSFFRSNLVTNLVSEAVKNSVEYDRVLKSQTDMIHLNDYLDHEGFRPETLLYWHKLFMASSDEQMRDLFISILMKPETISGARQAYLRRLEMYGRISDWTASVGALLVSVWDQYEIRNCLPADAMIEGIAREEIFFASEKETEKLYHYLTASDQRANSFYKCFISLVESGAVEVPKTPEGITRLLYMHKISSDFLAKIASELNPY